MHSLGAWQGSPPDGRGRGGRRLMPCGQGTGQPSTRRAALFQGISLAEAGWQRGARRDGAITKLLRLCAGSALKKPELDGALASSGQAGAWRDAPGLVPASPAASGGDTAAARGCSSCTGALPKNKVLQPREPAAMLGAAPGRLGISGCCSPSTGAAGAKLGGSIAFSFPSGRRQSAGNRESMDVHPQRAGAAPEHRARVPRPTSLAQVARFAFT